MSGTRRRAKLNFQERGFDFAFASLVFDEKMLIAINNRRDYGEVRFVGIGSAEGIHLTVVYKDREDSSGEFVRRIISARRSSRRERQLYDEANS